MHNKLIHTIFLLTTTIYLYGGAPKYSNEFLNIGAGGRSLAMARSTVATIHDVTSAYWNPAGLASLEKDFELGVMHIEYPHGIATYDYFGGVTRILDSLGTLGLSVIRMGVDDIPNTLNMYDDQGNINPHIQNDMPRVSVADYAFLLSYAKKTSIPGLGLGINAKVIHRIIGDFASSWGFGLDVGAQYNAKKWHFGLVGRDITSTFNAWDVNTEPLEETFIETGNELPENSLEVTLPRLLIGIGRNFKLSDQFSILTELNADMFFDGKRNELIKTDVTSISPHLGIEINYNDAIFVRGGAGNIHKTPDYGGSHYTFRPTVGVGIHFLFFDLDYAITEIGETSKMFFSHIFSLNIAFNKF